ncbi:MAG TPA: oligoribonuclease [Kineosporiaceae bacterium]|nr:oligoribonuclease [Kineosporiaceae bacterium]
MSGKEKDTRLLWVDVETPWLGPAPLLEVGFLLTTAHLLPISSISATLYAPSSLRDAAPAEVQEMHDRSGLWKECEQSVKDAVTFETEVPGWLHQLQVAPRSIPMCGSSVHSDRGWLAHQMPRVEGHFHYRHVDVSSIKELAARWYPDLGPVEPAPQRRHRVIPDLADTLDELRWYRRHLFRTPPEVAMLADAQGYRW